MTIPFVRGIIGAMCHFAVPLSSLSSNDASLAGPKAAALGSLMQAGFPVPPGFCITTDAFRCAVAPYEDAIQLALSGQDLTNPPTAAGAAAEIAHLLKDWQIPDVVACELREQLSDLVEGPVAVRSSATAEDLAGVSFAGQYDTILGVDGEAAILAAVLACWRSFFNANALAARAEAAIGTDEAMAVIVQRLIPADVAGVAFSVDPVTGNRDSTVINAAYGLGLGVVDGSVSCDTYWLHRIGSAFERSRVVQQHIVQQDEQYAVEGGELRRIAVSEDHRRSACLSDDWAGRLAEFALAAEWAFGRAQDVEWAIQGTTVWILQSRPVTGLPEEVVAVPQFPVSWDSEEDGKRFWFLGWQGDRRIFPPLEQDYMTMHYASWDEACVFLGVDNGQSRIAVHNGRQFHSPTGGVLHEGDRRVRQTAGNGMARRFAIDHGMILWEVWGPEIIATTDRLRSFDREGASYEDLRTHYEDTLGAYRRHWMLHWFGFMPADLFVKAYANLTGIEGEQAEKAMIELSEGQETPFIDLMDGLYRLACLARPVPSVRALVEAHPPDVLARLHELSEAEEFLAELERFLDRFGDRTGSGFGTNVLILDPTWGETPDVVLAHIAPYLDETVDSPRAVQERTRADRAARADALCSAHDNPEAVAEFRRWLELSRREMAALEIHNYYIDQMAMAHVRLATMEVGRRFVAAGVIEERDDILWLRQKEIISLLQEETPASMQEVVASRKAEHAEWDRMIPPPIMGVPRAELPNRPPLVDDVEKAISEPGVLRGEAGSAGTVRGRARIVTMDEVLPSVGRGEILVAENAGPLWTPLFPHLGGIVLDAGAFGQHACTTAREFGVPVVINTREATRRIPDGAWITLDGAAGTVTIHDGADAAR